MASCLIATTSFEALHLQGFFLPACAPVNRQRIAAA
ncbi:hypothetical protein C6380_23830 [Pseudomonas syringae pv. actinidiae]|nr:hypothetical protein D9N00_14905 [Pseudomonas syringae pv. actinidiae]AYL81229.1 hypothetical protein CN228_15895 [Pseudomonas syringae pv. actinidiae str. Shaanxi_M228]MBL3874529.1 hypothetical protein [Pseudomonas syringae pv. theae]NAT29843.1 hypothetical protein [Pseudomonas syringae pv. actinidiae]NVL60828.1 hypothetical protein [Pseudomonas syringae pv. actinidiae]